MAAAPNGSQDEDLDRKLDELYARFGKPFEATHVGAYLAISPGGQTVVGSTLLEVMQRADAQFGKGNFLYKIGERAVGEWL